MFFIANSTCQPVQTLSCDVSKYSPTMRVQYIILSTNQKKSLEKSEFDRKFRVANEIEIQDIKTFYANSIQN